MPYTANGAHRIYWEEEGRGDPLLLIMGLGCSLRMWHSLRPALVEHFRVILLDNRGVGSSASPRGISWIPAMARDAAAVLDAAGVDSGHVCGLSMGGMIAQEFALRFPGRVRKLILGCTSCRGIPPRSSLRARLALAPRLGAPREEQIRAAVPFLFHPETPCERIDADVAVLMKDPVRTASFLAQIAGILAWRSCRRLPRINAETLVIHGTDDLLIPPENGRDIARRIPGAKLVLIPGAGHIFPTDQPQASLHAILDFLIKSRT